MTKLNVPKRGGWLLSSIACIIFSFNIFGCNTNTASSELVAVLDIPENVTVDAGTMEISFRIVAGMAPEQTDKLVLEGKEGNTECGFNSVTDRYVYATLPSGFVSGTYKVYVSRGDQKKYMGETVILIDYSSSDDIEIEDGQNLYGKVLCNGAPVENVVVSDGEEVVKTDAEGVYRITSAKTNGYVFISTPSGYTVNTTGILPNFYRTLNTDAATRERVDFNLVEDPGQENHTILVFGDMHLANRSNDDRQQFSRFTSEINSYLTANGGRKTYAITLGDMTWDLYWYTNNYCFAEYLNDINVIKGLTVWHTIGNHDHDMEAAGDFDTVEKYKNSIAPTYYSFNIGKVHYIILDDILCTNDGTGSRTYDNAVTEEQIEWLKKDLSYVSTETPLVISMHAPLYTWSGSYNLKNSSEIVDAVSQYSEVHFLTGHTHKMYNIDRLSSSNIFEHNAGAVCATWWWSAAHTPGVHIGQDGAPGGYTIMDVDGTDFTWKYKGTGTPETHQFRTYDRNQISITADKYIPAAYALNKTRFNDYAEDWAAVSNSNEVYINVWNYDPSWKIEVIENEKSLEVTKVRIKDPLHLIAYTAPAMNNSSKDVTPTFPTTNDNAHMFKVTASGPNTTLEIRVTDRFKNTYTETMTRPKAFNPEQYKF